MSADLSPKFLLALEGYEEINQVVHPSLREDFSADRLVVPDACKSDAWVVFRKKPSVKDKAFCLICGTPQKLDATGTTSNILRHVQSHAKTLCSAGVLKKLKRPAEEEGRRNSSARKRVHVAQEEFEGEGGTAEPAPAPIFRLKPPRALAEMILGLLLPFDLVNQPLFHSFVASLGHPVKITAHQVHKEKLNILEEVEEGVRLSGPSPFVSSQVGFVVQSPVWWHEVCLIYFRCLGFLGSAEVCWFERIWCGSAVAFEDQLCWDGGTGSTACHW